MLTACSAPPVKPSGLPLLLGVPGNLERLQLYAEDSRILVVAEWEAIKQCMEKQGFPYPYPAVSITEIAEAITFGIQDPDIKEAQESGYGFYEANLTKKRGMVDGDTDTSDRAVDVYVRSLSPAERKEWGAAFGGTDATWKDVQGGFSINTEGCLTAARKQVWGDVDAWSRIELSRQLVRNEIIDRTTQDKEFESAMTSWSICMGEQSWQFESPTKAKESISDDYRQTELDDPASLEKVRLKEIAIAVADAECTATSELASTFNEVATAYSERLSKDDERLLLQSQELRTQAVERAKQILGG